MAITTHPDWWPPHGELLRDLRSAAGSLDKRLDVHFEWLLNGLGPSSGLRPRSADSKKKVLEQKTVQLNSGKKIGIEEKLRDATVTAAVLLELDELQTHVLLRRWVKQQGLEDAVKAVAAGQQFRLDGQSYLQLLEYYHTERVALLQTLQLLLLEGSDPDFAHKQFLDRLLKAGAEDNLCAALRSSVESLQHAPSTGHAAPPHTLAGRMAALMKIPELAGDMAWLSDVHAQLKDCMLVERCELLSTLLALYEGRGHPCSSTRALELVRVLGSAVGPAAAGASNAVTSSQDATGRMLVSEHLSCMLVLSCLNLPEYVSLLQRSAADSQPPPSPEALPLGGKVKDVHTELRGWAGAEPSIPLLLTWAALTRLMDPYVDLGEASEEELQVKAQERGSFMAAAASLRLGFSLTSSATTQLCRSVAFKSLCIILAAYELGPSHQDSGSFSAVLSYVRVVLGEDPGTCSVLWDERQPLSEPVRALINDTASVFPAVPGPYLRLLAATSYGPYAAAQAYAHLQIHPTLLVSLHHASDPHVRRTGPNTVQLVGAGAVWNRAPSVATMALPQGVQGRVLPLPAVLGHLEAGQYALVEWDVGSAPQHPSFGQLLLLGRAVQLLTDISTAMSQLAPVDPELVCELSDTLVLLSHLTQSQPELVTDLLKIDVEVATGAAAIAVEAGAPATAKRTWLHVACQTVDGAAQLAAAVVQGRGGTASAQAPGSWPGGGGDSGAPVSLVDGLLGTVAEAVNLISAIAKQQPGSVLQALASLQLLAVGAGGSTGPSGFLASVVDPPHTSLPAEVPLPSLPATDLQAAKGVVLGVLPNVQAFLVGVEAATGSYPVTSSLLSLVEGLLAQGHHRGFPAAYTMFVASELLPTHHQRAYKDTATRWSLAAAALRVMLAAVEGGARRRGTSASPDPASPPGSIDDVTVTGLGAWVLRQLLLDGASLLSTCLPPPEAQLLSLKALDASSPELLAVESTVSALLRLLPPVLSAGAAFPHELPLEEYLFHGQHSSPVTPAPLLCGYLGYREAGDIEPEEQSISLGALRFLRALQGCVMRPSVTRRSAPLLLTVALPSKSETLHRLRQVFRVRVATAQPLHFLVACEVLEAALEGGQAEHLAGLMFPSGLEPPSDDAPAPGGDAAGKPLALPAPAPAGGASGKAAATRPPAPHSAVDGLLEMLGATDALPVVQCAAWRVVATMWSHPALSSRAVQLLRHQPSFWSALDARLSGVLPTTTHPPPATPGPSPGVSPSPAATYTPSSISTHRAQAYAWQVLLLEVYARPRVGPSQTPAPGTSQPGSTPAPPATPTAGAPALLALASAHSTPQPQATSSTGGEEAAESGAQQKLWALVDRLVKSGRVQQVAMEPLRADACMPAVRQLQTLGQALYLELAACAMASDGSSTRGGGFALDGAAANPLQMATVDGLSHLVVQELNQELSALGAMLASGTCSADDLEVLHAHLLSRAEHHILAQASMPGAGGSPGTEGGFGSPRAGRTTSGQNGGGGSPVHGLEQHQPGSPILGSPLEGDFDEAGGLQVPGLGGSLGAQRVAALLSSCPVGAAVLGRCLPSWPLGEPPSSAEGGLLLQEALPLLDPTRLPLALGPLAATLAAVDMLAAAMAQLSRVAGLLSAQLSSQLSCAALLTVLAQDPARRSPELAPAPSAPLPPTPSGAAARGAAGVAGAASGSSGADPLGVMRAGALTASVEAVTSLTSWATQEGSQLMTQPWSGLLPLSLRLQASALASVKLLLYTLGGGTSSASPSAVAPGAPAAGPAGGDVTPGLGGGRMPASSGGSGGLTPGGGSRGTTPAPRPAPRLTVAQCLQLSSVVAPWLRMADTGKLSTLDPGVAGQITESLVGCLLAALLHLQPSTPGPSAAAGGAAGSATTTAGDIQALQCLLLDVLPMVCKACNAGVLAPSVGVQMAQLLVKQYLPPEDWLPVLQQYLDVPAMIRQVASRLAPGQAGAAGATSLTDKRQQELEGCGDIGALQLALLVAQCPAGAVWLHNECNIMDHLCDLARVLLGSQGGGLAPFSSLTMARLTAPQGSGPGAQQAQALVRPQVQVLASASDDVPYSSFRGAPSQQQQQQQVAGMGADTAGVYVLPPGASAPVWSPAHQQWVTLLGFAGALLRTLGTHLEVQQAALDFLTVAEPRLMLMALPPSADAGQPLTLGSLLELQRALYLATQCSKYIGMWHLMLPGSLPKFRAAVTSFLAFAAGVSAARPVTLECPPQSADERAMATQPTGLPAPCWYLVCTLGASNPGQTADTVRPHTAIIGNPLGRTISNLGGAAASSSGGPGSHPGTPPGYLAGWGSGTPGVSPLGRGPSFSGGPAGSSSVGHTSGSPGSGLGALFSSNDALLAGVTSSAYSAALGDAVYACVHHALVFLLSSAPQVTEGEGGLLGPMWPKARDLLSLQDQCVAVIYTMLLAPEPGAAAGLRPTEPRRRQVAGNMFKILHLLHDLLDAVAVPPQRRAADARLRDHIAAMERAFIKGERMPPLAGVLSLASGVLSHGLSSQVSMSISMGMGMSIA